LPKRARIRSFKVKYAAIEIYVFTIASMDIFMSIRLIISLNQKELSMNKLSRWFINDRYNIS